MYCSYCGANIGNYSDYCPNCKASFDGYSNHTSSGVGKTIATIAGTAIGVSMLSHMAHRRRHPVPPPPPPHHRPPVRSSGLFRHGSSLGEPHRGGGIHRGGPRPGGFGGGHRPR